MVLRLLDKLITRIQKPWLLYFLIVLSVVALPAFLISNGRMFGLDTSVDDAFGEVEVNEVNRDTESINIWFQAVSFDPETQKARFNVYPWPSTDLVTTSFASSTVTKIPFTMFIDELNGLGTYDFEENQIVGSISVELDVLSYEDFSRSRDSFYPFDSYTLDTYADVAVIEDDDQFTPIKTFDLFYTNSVPGFNIRYQRVAAYDEYLNSDMFNKGKIIRQRDEGKISFIATFERSFAVKLTAVLLSLLCLFNSFTLVWICGRILAGRRPPSMQALVWSAASVLATIQLRDLYPGNPRLGIGLDYFSFFPSLIVSMCCGLVFAATWMSRNDFQI
jgi:hypothetical protein